jgi:DNA topoisomerase-1
VAAARLPASGVTPEELAKFARLRYVTDQDPGYARRRRGSGFVYLDHRGRRVGAAKVARVEQLAIPPAWRDVWICRYANGHLQATGRDSRKRKQYLYHSRWSEASNLAKFARLGQFGRALPALRKTLAQKLRGRNLTRERVLAGVVALLDATSIRIGNEEYVAQNGSYGLSTLRDRHVEIKRGGVELRFVGKGGFRKEMPIVVKSLVRLLKQTRAQTGAKLFQYPSGNGKPSAVTASEVNDFLSQMLGQSLTAKDFRTWKASALVARRLYEQRNLERIGQRRRALKEAIDEAAESLGNTATICRKYYIHPGLAESFLDGSFADHFRRFAPGRRSHFSSEEQVLARFLKRWTPAGTRPK